MSRHQIGYIPFASFTVTYAIGYVFFDFPLAYYFPILIFWLFVLIYGSFTIGFNYHIKAISKIKTQEKVVALTFDDGPSEFTPRVLDLLKEFNAKGTFFCLGKQVEKYPQILKQIAEEGHSLGNHSFTHTRVGFQGKVSMMDEIQKTDDAIEKISGQRTQFFRPPFGVTNPSIMRAVRLTGHAVVGWSIRSIDTAIKDELKILNRIKKRLEPGSIILLHDTSERSVSTLEQLLLYLREKGYKCLSIEEILKLEK